MWTNPIYPHGLIGVNYLWFLGWTANTATPIFLFFSYRLMPDGRRKFRSQFRQYGQMEKQRWKESEKRREEKKKMREEKESEERRCRCVEKVEKLRNIVFFQWLVAPEGRKVGSLKRRVRSHLARWEMKNFTPLWREAHFQVKSIESLRSRSTFGSWDDWKWHGAHFEVNMYKRAQILEYFWQLRCSKLAHAGTQSWREARLEVKSVKIWWVSEQLWSWDVEKCARRCGAKPILKSKCEKHTAFGPLLDVELHHTAPHNTNTNNNENQNKKQEQQTTTTTTTTTSTPAATAAATTTATTATAAATATATSSTTTTFCY